MPTTRNANYSRTHLVRTDEEGLASHGGCAAVARCRPPSTPRWWTTQGVGRIKRRLRRRGRGSGPRGGIVKSGVVRDRPCLQAAGWIVGRKVEISYCAEAIVSMTASPKLGSLRRLLTPVTGTVAPGKSQCFVRYCCRRRLDANPFALLTVKRTDVPDTSPDSKKAIAPDCDDAGDRRQQCGAGRCRLPCLRACGRSQFSRTSSGIVCARASSAGRVPMT